MKIFVSYKLDDYKEALKVSATLRMNDHEVYLDIIDNNLKKGTSDLSDYLRERLAECDSLIAVISSSTKESWWVPWEIGVATEKGYPLSTYLSDNSTPPEYLNKWPILKSIVDLGIFARKVKEYGPAVERLVRLSQVKSREEARHRGAEEFHREMKSELKQT